LPESRRWLARLAWHQGQLKRAQALYQDELGAFHERQVSATSRLEPLTGLAKVRVVQHDDSSARGYLGETFSILNKVPDPALLFQPLLASAMLALAEGQWAAAARLLGAARGTHETTGWVLYPLYQSEYDRVLAEVREALDESTFEAAYAEGLAMSPDQAIDYARARLQPSAEMTGSESPGPGSPGGASGLGN
jgi:hypothetical protein